MTQMFVSIITWRQDEICKLCIEIMWVVISQDYVIGRFCDYNITTWNLLKEEEICIKYILELSMFANRLIKTFLIVGLKRHREL